MSKRDAYKAKIEAELELAQAKLAGLKAKAKSSTADVHIKYEKEVEHLEEKLQAIKAKLKALGEASEDAWEKLKDDVEGAWGALSDAVRDAAAKFKD